MKMMLDVPYKQVGRETMMLDVYLPDSEIFSIIIRFHGGGLESGSRKLPIEDVSVITERGYGFVSVEYRMYPHAHFPDFIEDAADSVAFVLEHCKAWGGNGEVFVSSCSAGAYITMILCMDHRYLQRVGVKQNQIKGYISDSAQQFCHFNVLREMGADTKLERINIETYLRYNKIWEKRGDRRFHIGSSLSIISGKITNRA